LSASERREAIAGAARGIALDDGLGAITMRAVAARAGVAPGLVLHYEAGMDEVVAAAFAGIVRDELDEVRGLPLGALLDTLLDGTRSPVTLIWVQAWALAPGNPALAARVREEMDVWHGMLRTVVVQHGATEPDAVAAQILGMIDGLNAHALVRWGSPADRRALMGRAVEAMLGLAPGSLRERAQTSSGPPPAD
jgi:AcrR family transcriptional regulator